MKKLKVKNKAGEIDFEEVFLDKYSKERDLMEGLTEKKLEVPLMKTNFAVLSVLSFFMIVGLALFTLMMQLSQGEKYGVLAAKNQYIIAELRAARGLIYSRDRHQLVWNEVGFELWADKSAIRGNQDHILKEIARIIGEKLETINQQLASSTENEVLIAENLEHQALILLETKKEELTGFYVKKRNLRHYEKLESLSHILGYLGKISAGELQAIPGYKMGDYIGKEGLERQYENVLREKSGKVQVERNAQGKELSKKIVAEPESGDGILLYLDLDLQKKAEEALGQVIRDVGSKKGVVIAMNPQDGGILASVSLPGFDNNLFSLGISSQQLKEVNEDPTDPQLNRTIAGLYLTGSTIKPLVGVAALEEKVITPTTEIYGPLELCIEHRYTKEGQCFPDWQFHGWTNIKRAIAESVNPFFYIIGGGYIAPSPSSQFFDERLPKKFEGLGVERLAKYLNLFGLGKTTSIDLPGEAAGRLPTPEWKMSYFKSPQDQKWYQGDTFNLSIGQGYLLTTPLQLAVAFSALANGGTIFKPRIVQKILDETKKTSKEIPVEVIRENFVGKEWLEVIKQGMGQTISSPAGSAHLLDSLPVAAGGKTGTAQIYPAKEIYHNWIVVFAPYEKPEIVLVVLIEEVVGTRIAAQRVAKEILEWYFTEENSKHQALLEIKDF